MEYFSALSPSRVDFNGIEDPQDYIIHRQLFQKSLAARLQLAGKIDQLRQAVNQEKAVGPRALRRLWKLADSFHAGKIGLDDLSKSLGVSISNYGEAEAAIQNAEMSALSHESGQKAFKLRNIVAADQNLELLSRLFREQLTLEEVQYVSTKVPQMLEVIQALIPGENMQLWEDTVRSAIDYYAVAILRDKPMSAHAQELAVQHPDQSVVVVTGGFHTAGIVDELKTKKMSYIVVSPVVESQTAQDEALYMKRMMGIHITQSQIAGAARQARVNSMLGEEAVLPDFKADGVAPGTLPGSDKELQRRQAAAGAVVNTVAQFENGAAVVLPVNNSEQAAADAAVIDKFAGSPRIETPSKLQRLKTRLYQFLHFPLPETEGEIPVNRTPENVVDVPLQSNTKSGSLGAAGNVVGTVVAVAAVSSVLGGVNMSAQTAHQFTKVVQPQANSSALASAGHAIVSAAGVVGAYAGAHPLHAIGAGLAVIGGGWLFGTKTGRNTLEAARKKIMESRFGTAA